MNDQEILKVQQSLSSSKCLPSDNMQVPHRSHYISEKESKAFCESYFIEMWKDEITSASILHGAIVWVKQEVNEILKTNASVNKRYLEGIPSWKISYL